MKEAKYIIVMDVHKNVTVTSVSVAEDPNSLIRFNATN